MTTTDRATLVADVMTPHPITVRDTAPLREAQRRIQEAHVSGLPVVDADDRVVGVISQTDLLALARYDDDAPIARHAMGRVRAAMVSPAITVGSWAPIHSAAALLLDYRVHRLIVVDEDHRAVGILSTTDFVRMVADRLGNHR
jgi:CBS-domain-containing membrane protein